MTLGCEELLTHGDAAEPVANFMVRTGLLGQFRDVDKAALGMEAGNSKNLQAGPVGGSAMES